jgi:hypothetical protein
VCEKKRNKEKQHSSLNPKGRLTLEVNNNRKSKLKVGVGNPLVVGLSTAPRSTRN